MSKRVQMTEVVKQAIRNGIGDPEAQVDTFAVYEARFLSTEPITKRGIFNKARVSASTLSDMAETLNKEGGAIPLHIMHEDHLLPVGKVFKATVSNMANGETQLIGQFYLPADQTDLISKIESSVVDEVSVGILTKHAFCSECGFDYFGDTSSIMNFLDLTCENGHVIGVDGVHTRLVGLQSWDELSLVGSGAAHNAKILPRAKQSMSKEIEKLAANGMSFGALVLRASAKIEEVTNINPQGVKNMDDMKVLLGKFEESVSASAKKDVELEASKKSVTELSEKIKALEASSAEKDTKIQELEASKSANLKEIEDKAKDAETKLTAAFDSLLPHVKAALVASGVAETDLPTDLTAMVSVITEKGLKLHQVITPGGVSDTTKTDVDADKDSKDLEASRRKEAFKLSGK